MFTTLARVEVGDHRKLLKTLNLTLELQHRFLEKFTYLKNQEIYWLL